MHVGKYIAMHVTTFNFPKPAHITYLKCNNRQGKKSCMLDIAKYIAMLMTTFTFSKPAHITYPKSSSIRS